MKWLSPAPESLAGTWKDTTSRLLCALGIDGLATALHRRDLLVLTYHGIVDAHLDPPCPWQVEDRLFREQLAWLTRHRSVLTLDECVRALREGAPLPPRPAVLTFDDGYRSVRTRALPVLDRLGIPATVFVVTDAIGSGRLLWHDALYLALVLTKSGMLDLTQEGGTCHSLASPRLKGEALAAALDLLRALEPADREDVLSAIERRLDVDPVGRGESADFALLSAEEIVEMSSGRRIAIGAHGRTHTALTFLPEATARQEVFGSVARVRQLTGAEGVPFAYPFGQAGDLDATVADLVRASGATCALTTLPGLNAPGGDPFALRRIGVGAGLSIDRFRLRICGLSGWGLRSSRDSVLARLARWRSRLRPFRRFWRRRVFHRETIVVFERAPEPGGVVSGAPTGDSRVRFGPAFAEELRRSAGTLAPRDEEGFLVRVDERFRAGNRCFVLRRGTGIVALAWVSEGPRARIDEIEATVDVDPDAIWIFDALTLPEFRGRRLYPHLLDRIALLYGDRTKVIAAGRSNAASTRGIERAGFRPLSTHAFFRLAGLVLRGRAEARRKPPSPSGTPARPCPPPSPQGP